MMYIMWNIFSFISAGHNEIFYICVSVCVCVHFIFLVVFFGFVFFFLFSLWLLCCFVFLTHRTPHNNSTVCYSHRQIAYTTYMLVVRSPNTYLFKHLYNGNIKSSRVFFVFVCSKNQSYIVKHHKEIPFFLSHICHAIRSESEMGWRACLRLTVLLCKRWENRQGWAL